MSTAKLVVVWFGSKSVVPDDSGTVVTVGAPGDALVLENATVRRIELAVSATTNDVAE